MAPDFDLPVLIGGVKKRFHLREELKLRNIVLAFYPRNWQDSSARQLAAYQSQRVEFARRRSEIVGISVDSIMNSTSWERVIGPFDFPICSDFWPHGAVSQAYGVFRYQEPDKGASERAIVVVSQSGRIAFRKVYALDDAVTLEATLAALREI
jgi:peroxiredoxin